MHFKKPDVKNLHGKKTGRNIDRPELKKLLGELTAGDALIVWKIDRLGRSTRDICEVIDTLRKNVLL